MLLFIALIAHPLYITAKSVQLLPDDVFVDPNPQTDPKTNQQYGDYLKHLTRFDDWATGQRHVRQPHEVLPDDEFNDPKPQTNPNNTAFNDYVKELTRFDSWVTGKVVPIPADPATDALHQDLESEGTENAQASNFDPVTVGNPQAGNIGFPDYAPPDHADPTQAFKDYAKVLTRFDSWVTGVRVPIPADSATDALHQKFRRSVISSEKSFADKFEDQAPVNPTGSSSYNDFVKKLKRFDPSITGHKVPIPRDATTDTLHQINKRSSLNGSFIQTK